MSEPIPDRNTLDYLAYMCRPITNPNLSHTEMAWQASRIDLYNRALALYEANTNDKNFPQLRGRKIE